MAALSNLYSLKKITFPKSQLYKELVFVIRASEVEWNARLSKRYVQASGGINLTDFIKCTNKHITKELQN